MQIYSGGLGILAGDHCKSASDAALPFVGIGLLYRRGYFRQQIDADGHQEHAQPDLDPSQLPLRRARGARRVAAQGERRDRRSRGARRRLGGPGRARADPAARHRHPGQRPVGSTDHPHPLRPRPRDAPLPGADPGHRRRPRPPCAGHRAGGLAPERGPLGVPARRARRRARRRRAGAVRRRGAAARRPRRRLHHPHAGPGRQRGLRARARDPSAGHVVPRGAHGARRAARARARPHRRPRRAVRHDRLRAAPRHRAPMRSASSTRRRPPRRGRTLPVTRSPPSPTASTSRPGSAVRCGGSCSARSACRWGSTCNGPEPLASARRRSTTRSCGRLICSRSARWTASWRAAWPASSRATASRPTRCARCAASSTRTR